MPTTPNIRVVVRVPYNRPEHPLDNPPRIEWNAEKANILWEVIARSRISENGATDWKGLAAHLEVPLPYLLYRAQMRYEDDLRGLQDITGKTTALSPNPLNKPSEVFQFPPQRPPISPIATSSRMTSSIRGLSSSTAILATPLGVRARLSSLGQNSPGRPIRNASSSSTITVQGPKKKPNVMHMRPFSPSSSEGSDSEDEEAAREEEADRKLEEQEALDQKLKDLQKIITGDALGLVSSSQSKADGKGKSRDRGRIPSTQGQPRRYRADELSSRSQSVSSASSPQGSIPSIPSPPPEARFDSLAKRHFSPNKSSSPPVVSPRSAHGRSHPRYGPMGRRTLSSASEQESHGSSASSFSDLSDASLSASALESALMSNIKGGGSRLSTFARSRFSNRGGGGGGGGGGIRH